MMALDVIDISAEGLLAHVVAESPHRKTAARVPAEHPTGGSLTECEAFLLRLGRKALELEGLRW
jgi:hypothetical protein